MGGGYLITKRRLGGANVDWLSRQPDESSAPALIIELRSPAHDPCKLRIKATYLTHIVQFIALFKIHTLSEITVVNLTGLFWLLNLTSSIYFKKSLILISKLLIIVKFGHFVKI